MSACTSISFLKSPPQADGLFSHLSLLPLPTPLNSLYPSRQKITPLSLCLRRAHCRPSLTVFSINAAAKTSSGGGDSSSGGNGGYNAGGGGGNEGNDDEKRRRNRAEAFMALAKAGRTLDSLPKYLQAAIEDGGIPAYVVQMFFDTEKSISGLVGRSKEKLFADDLFLAQYAMKPGVGVFTKIAAEYERRRDNFFNELEIVFADEVMAVVADCFKLDYLLNPTVSPRTPVALNAEPIYNFFKRVAFPGSSFSLLQTIGPIVRNGAKMFAVGIIPSLVGTVVGTVVTNAFMNAGKAVDGCAVLTSAACDVSMAASFNLRYKLFAGAVKQRILKPLLHQHNLLLSAIWYAVKTGNKFSGLFLCVFLCIHFCKS